MRPGSNNAIVGTARRACLLACALTLGLSGPQLAQACVACGCSLNSDAAVGYLAAPGWVLSLEYDYLPQQQLRSGTHAVSRVPDGVELEQQTISRYLSTGLSYGSASGWDVSLLLPYLVRTHSTYGTFDSTAPLPAPSSSHSASLGDLRLIGSYQGLLPTRNLGLQLGLKLPTGQYGSAVKFDTGPGAGTPLDASLQPGTGSTDVIAGAYYHRQLGGGFDLLINGQFQAAVKHRLDQPGNDYRPGNSTTLSVATRYQRDSRYGFQLKVNLLHRAPDQGALADIQNTAGNIAYLSPGLTARLTPLTSMVVFAQLPVYSNLYGYQLLPRWTAGIGVTYAP
jgi:hypothetical protein